MKKITIDPKYTKTYKNEITMEKALEKLNLPDDLRYIVCEVEGRVTPVFTNSLYASNGMWMNFLIHRRFKIVG